VRSGVKRTVFGGAALAVGALLAFPAAANAIPSNTVPGTATLSAGTLTMTTPIALGFSGTLDGTDKVLTAPQAIDVLDQTGSGAGWNITLTSTQFATGDATPLVLAFASASDVAVDGGVCDATVTCTLATGSTVTYPLVVPAAVTAPTAVKIQNAAVDTGLAGQTFTHTMNLAVPANTKVGVYTSTWTYSLVSAP
jgi:hypothetical protein